MSRILVIDDEELARFTIREILESAGFEVDEAENGRIGVEKQQATPFDLIITDIIMPEKEGVETIIDLKQEFPNLRIIAISGGGRTRNLDFLKLSERFGASKLLAKPFTEGQLLEAVAEVMNA
ncbi:MAG: response regulator [Rhodospirillales bacterium]|nr:response regulator [Rhodospirillales bacterium]